MDGHLVGTDGECKEGMDIAYDGTWGHHPLLVSLANTGEVLRLVNRSGNRPSHEGAAAECDRAIALCRRAGFRRILLRGDTDFSQTKHRRPSRYEVQTQPRRRPDNVKARIVREREFEVLRLNSEEVAEFEYRPTNCKKTYRMIVIRKNISGWCTGC